MFSTRTPATKILWAAGALLLLAPSAWYAIRYASMPQLGAYHDDVVYWTSAQALAGGPRYEIPYLAERPAQTKYPPLYPVVLSAAWLANRSFPENLTAALAVQWLFFPVYVWLLWRTFRRFGFPAPLAYGLTLMASAAPMTVVFSTALMTEIPFTAAVLASLILIADRDDPKPAPAFAAGLCTAAAFLIRTNGIALAASAVALLLAKARWKAAAAFVTPVVLAVAGWMGWCAANAIAIRDDRTAYYATYAGFFVHTFSWRELPLRLWVNLTTLPESLGGLVSFQVEPGWLIRCLLWVIAAAAVSGVVDLWRRGIARSYSAFALVFLALLTVWPFPPGDRFVYPLLPLVLAGVAVRVEAICRAIAAAWRRAESGDRPLAALALVFVAASVLSCVGRTAAGLVEELPRFYAERETQRDRMAPVYSWIRAHTPQDARLAAYDDGLLFLYTKRRGYYAPIMPARTYAGDPGSANDYVDGLPERWEDGKVTHVLVTAYDFRREPRDPAAAAVRRLVADRSRFRLEYSDPAAQVYRFLGTRLQREDLFTNRIERQPALLDVRNVTQVRSLR